MPTYEYECTKCGTVFELVQPITEAARRKLRKKDPKPCGCNAPVHRLIGTGAGVIFKGSGFYQTDYRSESYKKGAKAEKESREGKTDAGKADDGKKKSAGTKDDGKTSNDKA